MMREILENILKINNEPCLFALFAPIHINNYCSSNVSTVSPVGFRTKTIRLLEDIPAISKISR